MTDDVVGIPLERHPRHCAPEPDIERVVEKQVSQKRRNNPALRRAPVPRNKFPIIKHRRRLQPTLDIENGPDAVGMSTDRLEQQLMINVVKETLDVDIEHPVRSPASLARRPDCIDRRPTGTISI